MNILIPDSWLREFLKTDATPKQIKEYLSLCGPSVERINKVGNEYVYDIEITGNRPDAMSVLGIAREAGAILPRFGIEAEFINDPYAIGSIPGIKAAPIPGIERAKMPDPFDSAQGKRVRHDKMLSITTNQEVNPRFTAIVLDHIKNQASPEKIQRYLTLSGMRPINTVVDITNYLMKAYGQPVHAFDYDQILSGKDGIPAMTLRLSKKGESITTLDGKKHILPGDDIVIEDGSGRLIDLCGIMGGEASHITDESTRIVLFVQTYDPSHIRKTSMALSHRTEAAGLFERGLDTELVMPTALKGIELLEKYTGGRVTSPTYDLYPKPFATYEVTAKRSAVDTYIGTHLSDTEIRSALEPLGCTAGITETDVTITVPSWRRDIAIGVDVIEEIARMYGYHAIKNQLPNTEPPMAFEDPILKDEHLVKELLKGWGYTEIISYSMISDRDMDVFGFSKEKTYAIANPLSSEWISMRPSLIPSMLMALKQNMSVSDDLKLFELTMVYGYRSNDLPDEHPILIVGMMGQQYPYLKGIAETMFQTFGIPFPKDDGVIPKWYNVDKTLGIGGYGMIGELSRDILEAYDIRTSVTIMEIDVRKLSKNQSKMKRYQQIPKFPPSYEDLALIVPDRTLIGPMISDMKKAHPLIADVTLLDSYHDTRTFHVVYQSKIKNLTSQDIQPIREKLLTMLSSKYQAELKGI